MKWAHRLLGLLIGATLIGLLFRVLLPAFQGGDIWVGFMESLIQQRHAVILVGLALLIALFAYVLTGLSSRPGSSYLAYETEFGAISISLKALQDFLSHIRTEFPTILALTPRVTALDESLDVVMEVKIRSGAPVPDISRMLQERARQIIHDKIGIADIRGIEIKIEEIVKEKEPKAQEITPMPPPTGDTP
ncbi:MAG TPA: hypothetical protein PKE26_02425 [Kiritimatiellia bacterium]|nr:hypothetical protein [Kiritimatiellia bacterium]HMO97944.1 hypothetical protein [Kiritimatiellia bacterium]HMP95295.1 hypothetical protein [Kiritimatiellia bacterium]